MYTELTKYLKESTNNFFNPSWFKIKVTLALVLYILVSTIFISFYNTTRSRDIRELGAFDKIGLMIAYPAVYLILPLFYVSGKVFTAETTPRELMKRDGMTNDPPPDVVLDAPITHATPLGSMVGLIVEILFLYCLACLFSSLREYKRSRA